VEKELLDLLQQTVTIEPCTGENSAGEPVYGAAVTYACRVEEMLKTIYNKEGVLVTSTAQVFVDGVVPVGERDRVTLPSGLQPLILNIEVEPDETGAPYYKGIYT
jgi:hypothetical protein